MNRRGRWLAAPLALGLALAGAASTPAAAANLTLGERVTALFARGGDWRAMLASDLTALPGEGSRRTVSGTIGGQLLAGTLVLPATLELAGDTTILARRVVFTGGSLHVTSRGHALRLFPVSTMGTEQPSGVGTLSASIPSTSAASTITIDTSGMSGSPGGTGFFGTAGFPGVTGSRGNDAPDYYVCDGGNGGSGSNGQDCPKAGKPHPANPFS